MRKILSIMAICLAVISCQQEELPMIPEKSVKSNEIQLVEIVNDTYVLADAPTTRTSNNKGLALRFDTENTYQSFLEQIKQMSSEERVDFIKSYGLTSLQEIAIIADEELELIGETATSEADFRSKYDDYKEKYEGILIPNKYDSKDLSLYVPDGDNLSTYLINENATIVIGNRINKISVTNDMSASDKALFTNTETRAATPTSSFHFKKKVNGKQTIIDVKLETSSGVRVHVGCQKDMWYGSKRDNGRDLYFNFSASPFYYTYEGLYGQVMNAPLINMHVFKKTGKLDYWVGGLTTGNILTGKISLWTDQIVEKTNRIYKLTLMDRSLADRELPICNENRAYGGSFTLHRI